MKTSKKFFTITIEGTENRITIARRDFIEAVKLYNLELRTILENL